MIIIVMTIIRTTTVIIMCPLSVIAILSWCVIISIMMIVIMVCSSISIELSLRFFPGAWVASVESMGLDGHMRIECLGLW